MRREASSSAPTAVNTEREREESSSREHRSSWADGLAPVLGANDACGSSGRSGVVPSSSACHWRVGLWKKGGLPRRRSTRIITCADPRKHSRFGGCGVRIIRSPHVRPVLESSSLAWSPRWALTLQTDRHAYQPTDRTVVLSPRHAGCSWTGMRAVRRRPLETRGRSALLKLAVDGLTSPADEHRHPPSPSTLCDSIVVQRQGCEKLSQFSWKATNDTNMAPS